MTTTESTPIFWTTHIPSQGRHVIQYNDIQHNNIQHNDIQPYNIQYNNIQRNNK